MPSFRGNRTSHTSSFALDEQSYLSQNLRCHPELLKLNHNIIQEHREFNEQVDDAFTTSDVHYLSHHVIKKDSQTTPIQVLYDCSCCESVHAASLNDCLTVGSPFIDDLCAMSLRFRSHLSRHRESIPPH